MLLFYIDWPDLQDLGLGFGTSVLNIETMNVPMMRF
ncbi:hypothetical protein SHDE107825_12970 [Shewanella denitrificans]